MQKTYTSPSGIRILAEIGNIEKLIVIPSGDESPFPKGAWNADTASVFTVMVENWNRDLSPWPAPACFKGGEAFLGGADVFLKNLINEALPEAECDFGLSVQTRALAGYSLSGLFSLFAAVKTDFFHAFASVSGSLWFDDFVPYLANHPPLRKDACFYLSLGDTESATRNLRLKTVEEATLQSLAILKPHAKDIIYEKNPGNHFRDPDKRMLRAMNWLFP